MNKKKIKNNEFLYEAVVLLVIINSMGFLGNYESIFGSLLGAVMNYGCFLLEIIVMLLSSGDELMEIKVINLKENFRGIYLVIAVFTVVSMIATHSPKLQIITCIRFAVTLLFIIWICDMYSTVEILKFVCRAQMIYVILTLIFTVLRPGLAFNDISGEMSFVGLQTTKNPSATEMTIGIVMFLIYFKYQIRNQKLIPKIYMAGLALQIVMLFMCNATGALIIELVVSVFVIYFVDRMGEQRRIPLAWMYLIGSIGFLVLALTILPLFSDLLELIGKDATLTGRTPLWEAIIEFMLDHKMLTGYGYAMFWRDGSAVRTLHTSFDVNSFMGNMTSGAHNLLLELWLNVGLLGIGAFFIGMLDCMKKIRELTQLQYEICGSLFIIMMLTGFTERLFGSANSFGVFFLFLAMGIACCREKQKGEG